MPPIDSPVTSITWGTALSDPNVSVYFVPAGDSLGGYTSEGATAYEVARFQEMYDTISTITNLSFTVTNDPDADFRIVIDDDELPGTLNGQMGPPGGADAGIGIFNGQNILREPGGPLDSGGYDYMVLMHETMHALGLAHPHDDGGGSTIMDGVDGPFGDFGDFGLNQGLFTVMTYNNGYFTGTPGSGPDGDHIFGYETGPMALDIAVLQSLYGANTATATGDDGYGLPTLNEAGIGWTAIWDAGGTDEISYAGNLDATIDLRAATLLYEAGGGGFGSSVDGIAGGFTIANGVVIENASSGGGDDVLTGNGAANVLFAGGGEDTITGGAGADTLAGGAGDDVLAGGADGDSFLSGSGHGDDVIEDFDPAVDVLVFEGIDLGGAGAPASITEFLVANGSIDGSDYVIAVDGTHSVRLLDVITGGDPEGSVAAIGGAIAGLEFDGGGEESVPSEGDDVQIGGPDGDTIDGPGGSDSIGDWSGFDLLDRDDGNDVPWAEVGNGTPFGGAENDWLPGGEQDDLMGGSFGKDRVDSQQGNVMDGDEVDDTTQDSDGQDRIISGAGNDEMCGGKHADTFVSGVGRDFIDSFGYGEDLIELSDVSFGDGQGQKSQVDFLPENGSIADRDLYLDLGDGRSIRILDVVDEDEAKDEAEDYEDMFALA